MFNEKLGYQITVLNYENISKYVDMSKYFNHPMIKTSSPQFISDVVRIVVIRNLGGIWLDASIIINAPLDFFNGYARRYNAEFVGYYLGAWTTANTPMIESWAFASESQSNLMIDWQNQLDILLEYPSKQAYIDNLKKLGVNFWKLPACEYFVVFCALQYLLQFPKHEYRIFVFKAENTAYKFLADNITNFAIDSGPKTDNEGTAALDRLIRGDYRSCDIVKLSGMYRDQLLKKNWQKIFAT
jgi:hypothetical protein